MHRSVDELEQAYFLLNTAIDKLSDKKSRQKRKKESWNGIK
jgi:hypothetical protein